MGYTRAWLDYQQIGQVRFPFDTVYVEGGGKLAKTAAEELVLAAGGLANVKLDCIESPAKIREAKGQASKNAIFLKIYTGTGGAADSPNKEWEASCTKPGAFLICMEGYGLRIEGADGNGLLYGVFETIRLLQTASPALSRIYSGKLCICKSPKNPLRMLNHWDNMDGSIERGYSGRSFFFKGDDVIVDERTRAYARLLASVGINGTVVNNVNVRGAATWLVTGRYLGRLAKMAGIFEEYGIKLYLSLNFAAPMELGGLGLCDPLNKDVREFWERTMREVYTAIPGLGGFLVKADSEGRPGPFTYGRNHADGANMLARAVAPYGGIIIWRCFVYNCSQDWRDYKTDRARAGYDNFMPLDGKFLDNVVLQIKNGPMDFQVREAVSPLFSGLRATNQVLEVQAAQEYTGQQKHLCYLVPMWKEVLDFKTYACGPDGAGADTVADIVSGRLYGQAACGMAAVANTGDDENWTGHDMAAANLYGFGRLAFDTGLTAEEIAREWIRCTYGCRREIMEIMLGMLMESWQVYESYTSPLGIGWMVNPSHHYGPNVDGYEYDRWGTYHRSDCHGMGVDRTREGTGYTTQYNEPNASMYESLETCPEELLLFFHHVPYTYRLKSGKTLIQHIYDSHFEGAMKAQEMARRFETLEPVLEPGAYGRILSRLKIQSEHAKEWRDRINTYYFRMSGIPDEKGRRIY